MNGDRHLDGVQKSIHPFEEIISKEVTVVIKVNSKLSKHGLYTCPYCNLLRCELSYLASLGSENFSAPYFKQCFFRGGGYYPPD